MYRLVKCIETFSAVSKGGQALLVITILMIVMNRRNRDKRVSLVHRKVE